MLSDKKVLDNIGSDVEMTEIDTGRVGLPRAPQCAGSATGANHICSGTEKNKKGEY